MLWHLVHRAVGKQRGDKEVQGSIAEGIVEQQEASDGCVQVPACLPAQWPYASRTIARSAYYPSHGPTKASDSRMYAGFPDNVHTAHGKAHAMPRRKDLVDVDGIAANLSKVGNMKDSLPVTVGIYLKTMPTGTDSKNAMAKRSNDIGTPAASTPACSISDTLCEVSASILLPVLSYNLGCSA